MSTSAVHATPTSWKQEVNRRLAEHRGRKPASQPEPQQEITQSSASRKAQEAAARVAARYAKAPSFNELLASEARAALRAAEAASEAALQAQAAAESVLAGIEKAAAAEPVLEPRLVASAASEPMMESPQPIAWPEPHALPQTMPLLEPVIEPHEPVPLHEARPQSESLTVRWAQELPEQRFQPEEHRAMRGDSLFEEEWWKLPPLEPMGPGRDQIEMVEPAQPIVGNLIEFPRELVATRKARPRLAEAPERPMQLSIFEVEPEAIATEPEAVQATAVPWTEPAWSGMQLDAHPQETAVEELLEEPAPLPQPVRAMQPADFNRRLLAVVTDSALIAGALVGGAYMALTKLTALPAPRTIELAGGLGLVLASAFYVALFLTLASATPGMKYARIRFCTFEGATPTREQRRNRLMAMLLSVLPVGLGLAWSLFDENHLCWHDRLSRTYIANQ